VSMFYIVVDDGNKKRVVSSSNGHPREFPKHKKARNFINGRPFLRDANSQIVTEIDGIKYYMKVDI
jgi:hypothetical protein